ncbi:MAG: hypothetical protein KC910_13190 [Candidatus Eremiobacteraeota bacterium]|nr:hypothetical protein [Candidatus Eremiobacteraeota bacterium]
MPAPLHRPHDAHPAPKVKPKPKPQSKSRFVGPNDLDPNKCYRRVNNPNHRELYEQIPCPQKKERPSVQDMNQFFQNWGDPRFIA